MQQSAQRPLAVVTGASSGIGYELAKQFAEHGFDLVISAHQQSVADITGACEQLGAQVTSVQADQTTYNGVEALYSKIISLGRPVEALAINAGVGVGGEFTQTSLEDELNLIHLNVTSAVHLAKRVIRGMVERGQGRILFTSSIAALMPGPFEAVYAASKAFLHSFAEALRNELKDTGVTVTSLLPGPTDTSFFERAEMEDTRAGAGKKDDPAKVAQQGFEALMAGKDRLIAGSVMNKVQGNLAKVLPESVSAEQHRKLTEPGSGDKGGQ